MCRYSDWVTTPEMWLDAKREKSTCFFGGLSGPNVVTVSVPYMLRIFQRTHIHTYVKAIEAYCRKPYHGQHVHIQTQLPITYTTTFGLWLALSSGVATPYALPSLFYLPLFPAHSILGIESLHHVTMTSHMRAGKGFEASFSLRICGPLSNKDMLLFSVASTLHIFTHELWSVLRERFLFLTSLPFLREFVTYLDNGTVPGRCVYRREQGL